MEDNVGITNYLNNLPGVKGIIKMRYSDFLVNEIDLDGNIVHLTDATFSENSDSFDIENLFDEGQLSQIEALSKGSNENVIIKPAQLLSCIERYVMRCFECFINTNNGKSDRTKMHNFLKKHFPHLSSETVTIDGEKCIVITACPNQRDNSKTNFKDYCKFVLYKENKSTMDAIEYICSLLKVNHSLFSFAGTKDKRAITTQEVTAYRMHPNRLIGLNKCLKNVFLGNFRACKKPLRLGDLKGNHFQIILRNITDDEKDISRSLESLKLNGFINYFGMQRFGATEICNSQIGKYIIKSDWMMAIDFILKPRQEENLVVSNCRKIWDETHDPAKALESLRNYSCIEKKLLEGLCKYSQKNAVAALSLIPRNMRLMYLHAYQSLIWNKIVSKRFQEHKMNVLIGDLFQTHDQDKSVSIVTEENIGTVKLTDLVLPQPGFDVEYPHNEIQTWYDELLNTDGLHRNSFKHKIREYSLSGSYRKIIIIPGDCKWEFVNYTNAEDVLLLTDKNILDGTTLTDKKDGPHKALRLEMSLPTSAYATMAIREVTKEDTSSANQTLLTKNITLGLHSND